ncbi:MAG: hypothetical protein Q7S58_15080 [Candidatus Binatus sp.]|uniref:hypothetical protein n=1 Tax=Candidatus Binatus sp. TaxID=2811406 RepID=UPI00271DB3E5|nr:hypothetical protein [Candidatus Binatus sp.]MDO8433726.1 hypothetical protein [Candidatus Binatus sp.]
MDFHGIDQSTTRSPRLMLQALLKRTRQIELNGKVERLRSNFLAGIKHMPVRFTESRAAA